MNDLKAVLENYVLPRVSKPLRYVGNEYNAVHKEWDNVGVHALFAFPDIYEVGMSHLGLRILYHLVNDQPEYLMERVFAPWPDMEKELRERKLPLFSLESTKPLCDFDLIGFTLQYEMSYSNILTILDLGRIPLLAAERDDNSPLVIAGGPCAYNPEPLVDFFDLFVLGEGEEVFLEILETINEHRLQRQGKQNKNVLLQELAQISGVYVPTINKTARKRVVADLEKSYFPTKPIVPNLEIVHDRIMLEVMRGCTRGCRFCQAGMIYRPIRERSEEALLQQAEQLVLNTGYNEISLTSLSTSDYSGVEGVIDKLLNRYEKDRVGISLPSLRVDSFSVDLAKEVQRVRKTGLTFAPEAGTQRLRDVINKGVTEEDLMEVIETVFREGWTNVKLYFMMGLPTETFQDLDGIADLAYKSLRKGQETLKEIGSRAQPKITVSVSTFVPKAHTPFQWEGQDSLSLIKEKQYYLKGLIKDRRISYKYHDAPLSFLEAVFARGGRELGKILLEAWQRGCRFDSWTEHFRFDIWQSVFEDFNYDASYTANQPREFEEALPWDHLSVGVTKEFLWKERNKAYAGTITPDCRFTSCPGCGVCPSLGVAMNIQQRKEKEINVDPS